MARIDPQSADYLPASRLATLEGSLSQAAYVRLRTPLGSYWRDADLGSRLHELRRMKDLPRIQKLAKQYAEAALKLLPAVWRVKEVIVEISPKLDSRLHLRITLTRYNGQQSILGYWVEVGG